jgi:hypothetical protein
MDVWGHIVNAYAGDTASLPAAESDVPDTHKMCTRCKEVKRREDFYVRRGHSWNAVASQCKPCHVLSNKERQLRSKRRKLQGKL